MALIHFSVIRSRDACHIAIGSRDLEITSYSAVGAHCSCFLGGTDGLGLEDIGDGRGGASLRTGSATDAVRFHETLIQTLDDLGIEASSGHVEDELSLHFITGPDAAVAIDALGKVRGHVRVAVVLLTVQMGLTFRIAHIPDAHLSGHGLQFAVAIDLTGQAIQWMIGEDQLDDVLPQVFDGFCSGIDALSFSNRGMA